MGKEKPRMALAVSEHSLPCLRKPDSRVSRPMEVWFEKNYSPLVF